MNAGQSSDSVSTKAPPDANGHTSSFSTSNLQSTKAQRGKWMGSLVGSAGSANLRGDSFLAVDDNGKPHQEHLMRNASAGIDNCSSRASVKRAVFKALNSCCRRPPAGLWLILDALLTGCQRQRRRHRQQPEAQQGRAEQGTADAAATSPTASCHIVQGAAWMSPSFSICRTWSMHACCRLLHECFSTCAQPFEI